MWITRFALAGKWGRRGASGWRAASWSRAWRTPAWPMRSAKAMVPMPSVHRERISRRVKNARGQRLLNRFMGSIQKHELIRQEERLHVAFEDAERGGWRAAEPGGRL